MRTATLLLILATLNGAWALKGQRSQLRSLQDALPKEGGAKEPKEGEGEPKAPKEGEVGGPKESKDTKESKDPKEADVKGDDKKEKKEKKCKKAPKVSEPAASPNDAPDASPIDEPYCLQGDVTDDECQDAKGGKVPKGHSSIKGDVEINVSYLEGSSATDVLTKVEQVIRSETGAEFIGCGKKGSSPERRLQDEGGTSDPPPETTEETTDDTETEEDDVRVTGVDFQKVEITAEECQSSESGRECDVIASEVEIYYQGSDADLTDEEKKEMFALLASTIESQAASGAFDGVGTVESVEIVNVGEGSTGGDNGNGGLGTRAIAGIPSGIGGLLAIAVAGFVIYKMLGRDTDENGIDASANNAAPAEPRIVEAEAVVMDANPDPKDEGTWAKMKNQFL